MLPRLSMVHQQNDAIYFFVEVEKEVMYARAIEGSHWLAQSSWEVPLLKTCQFCAKDFDPKVTMTPRGYCSTECSSYGERPYNRQPIKIFNKQQNVEEFARGVVDHLHYLSHDGDDRFDCDWDICVKAKILGL